MKKFIVYFIGLTLMAIGWLLLGFPFIAGICFDETSRLETVIKPTVEKIQAGVKQIDQNLQKKYHTKKVDPKVLALACSKDEGMIELKDEYALQLSLNTRDARILSIKEGIPALREKLGVDWWIIGGWQSMIFGFIFITLSIIFSFWAFKRYGVDSYPEFGDICSNVMLAPAVGLIILKLFLAISNIVNISDLPLMGSQSTLRDSLVDKISDGYLMEALCGLLVTAVLFGLLLLWTMMIEEMDFCDDLGDSIEKLIKKIVKKVRKAARKRLLKSWLKSEDGKDLVVLLIKETKWKESFNYPELRDKVNHGEEVVQFSGAGIQVLNRRIEQKIFGDLELPTLDITKNVSRTLNAGAYIQLIANEAANDFLSRLKQLTMSRSQEHLSKKQVEELARKYVEVLKVKADAQFRELHDQKGKQLISESRERLAGVVANHAKRVMMDYKKELSKSGGETLRELLGDFFEELSKKIYDASNPLVNVTLPPANTRFFYNNGSNTVAVVEQPPQIRTVIVKDKLAGTTKGQELYRISLPYVIFVVKLSDNKFEGLYVYYRKRPLESMRSRLYETNFPNTKSCNVCLGFDGHKSEDLGERINEIITHFWNSPFNKDWNGSYEEYQSEDSRLSFRNWEIETRENPNFIFDVKWSQASTLSERINSLVNLDDHKKALKVKLDAATDNFQEQLLMALDDLPIFNDIKERAMTAIDKHESAIIIQLSKLIEQTFMDVNQDPNFDQQCFEEISQIMSELLDKDFREISNALELRTQMSLEELMQAIKNSPEQ